MDGVSEREWDCVMDIDRDRVSEKKWGGHQNGTAGMHNHSRYWRRHGNSRLLDSTALYNGGLTSFFK